MKIPTGKWENILISLLSHQKSPASQLCRTCQMESPKPKERQKRKISYQFWEKTSGNLFAGSFLASPEAHLAPPKIQTRPR
jgi:hypothetical protein